MLSHTGWEWKMVVIRMGKTYENSVVKELQELNDECNANYCNSCKHASKQPCSIRERILELEEIIGD